MGPGLPRSFVCSSVGRPGNTDLHANDLFSKYLQVKAAAEWEKLDQDREELKGGCNVRRHFGSSLIP